jgi:uncharacterized membrane protein
VSATGGRTLRIVLIVLAVIGIGLTTYLTIVHYAGLKVACVQGHDECEAVQTSTYSKVAGVPVALMGLIGYILILGTLAVRQNETTRLATLALTFGGFAFSCYLTYREVFTLEKICEWCVSSAILLTIMMSLSLWRFWRGEREPAGTSTLATQGGAEPARPLGTAS